ncbi:MAG: hypothetical protein AVDCRST_MAG39-164 [uncultured Sphingomonadaceae bacterium]|uniref:ABC transporter domain-containing protein n=1 Tax=uncultured Sphingomonadaceae bacterium TaxID=169976 RepID=A0A6J4RSH5_9SPHN|nr:MAG: hypothetical protein AVDCRST_MAG39-164 [uncultured Sphingomonadaceae bacterium]
MTLVRATGLAIPGRLQPTDLRLAAGELVAVVGRNGAGKTSLLHALAGIGGARGMTEVAGERLDRAGPARRPYLLGFLPASRELAWPLRVADLVALGLSPAGAGGQVAGVLARFDLDSLARRRADRLSTGERARALLARAFAPAPPLLLLDEPMANLDPDWRLRLGELLQDEAARGAALVITLHDLETAERLADRLLVVADGRVVADGAPGEVLARVEVQAGFGLRRTAAGWVRA